MSWHAIVYISEQTPNSFLVMLFIFSFALEKILEAVKKIEPLLLQHPIQIGDECEVS